MKRLKEVEHIIWHLCLALGLTFLGIAAIRQSEALIALSKRIAAIEEAKHGTRRVIP